MQVIRSSRSCPIRDCSSRQVFLYRHRRIPCTGIYHCIYQPSSYQEGKEDGREGRDMQTGRLRKLCKCHVCRQGKGGVGYEHYFISDIRCSCEQCNPEPVHGYLSILGVSKKVSTAAGMGGAVIFVMTIASAVTSVIYHFVLVPL